jgi:hypothetical protein
VHPVEPGGREGVRLVHKRGDRLVAAAALPLVRFVPQVGART